MTADELAWIQFNLVKFQAYFIRGQKHGKVKIETKLDRGQGFLQRTTFQNFVL